jgi:flagellar L-ring protein precursor FlgH
MRAKWAIFPVLLLSVTAGKSPAQGTLWDRRDLNTVTMFHDYRARNVGDVLTVVIEETTGFDAQEKRNMEKQTNNTLNFNGQGTTSGTALQTILQSFGFSLNTQAQTDRSFQGNNNSSIDRKFTDRMSFVVVHVLPNGNLIVEGCRQRMITREMRTLRLRGIVRPADIGPFNTLQSQYIANLTFTYEGKGPESNYTNQGWGGRLMNIIWPF